MAEPLQAFLHLQRQVVIASQPDLLRDATSTPTASDISKMLILEKVSTVFFAIEALLLSIWGP